MKRSRLANAVPRLSTRETWAALGPCRRSGPPSRRPGWTARCPSATSPSTTCGPCSRCRARTGEAPPSSASSTPSGESRLLRVEPAAVTPPLPVCATRNLTRDAHHSPSVEGVIAERVGAACDTPSRSHVSGVWLSPGRTSNYPLGVIAYSSGAA